MTAHHVYVCRQADGKPLYVGCSSDLFTRLEAHRRTSFWAPLVVRVTATVHADRPTARAAERAAIRDLRPRFNVMGRWAQRIYWTQADYQDYLQALLARPNTGWKRTHIQSVHTAAAAARRFDLASAS